jgi:hypothetical protein
MRTISFGQLVASATKKSTFGSVFFNAAWSVTFFFAALYPNSMHVFSACRKACLVSVLFCEVFANILSILRWAGVAESPGKMRVRTVGGTRTGQFHTGPARD